MKTDSEIRSEAAIAIPDENDAIYGNAISNDFREKWVQGYKSSQSNIESEKEKGAEDFHDWTWTKNLFRAKESGAWYDIDTGNVFADSTKELYQIFLKESREDKQK